MEILFVDNKVVEFDRFLELPFASSHREQITHRKSPVGLAQVVSDNSDLRLIILDMLWESDDVGDALELGVDAMLDLSRHAPEVPVVIYSIIDDEDNLRRLIPEMIRLGAYDWISKDEPPLVRSFKLERAYNLGRNKLKFPLSRAILPADQDRRSNIHVAVMFCDMSGFTALSNELRTDDLIHVLRQFYAQVGEEIHKNGGYIDKYIGDAVMAVFGAIGQSAEEGDGFFLHVHQALAAARHIQAKAKKFQIDHVESLLQKSNLRWKGDKTATIGSMRIGLESGEVEVVRFARGNEAEITFIGTPVNIAARILNQGSPGELWIGENAHGTGAANNLIEASETTEYKNLPGEFTRYRVRV